MTATSDTAPPGVASVEAVTYLGSGLYGVTLALMDGRVVNYVVPDSLAAIEAVRISAVAINDLLTGPSAPLNSPHHRHVRYASRD